MEYFAVAPVTTSLLLANIIASMIGFAVPEFVIQNSFWVRPIRNRASGTGWSRQASCMSPCGTSSPT